MGAPTNHIRQRLTDLRNGLLRLHKTLLDSERAVYEHDVAKINNPGEFLGLLMHDPWFAWLRELSGLVVAIDEAMNTEEPATVEDADRLVAEARALLVPDEAGTGFAKRYYEALQRDPDVILTHGATMKLLAALE
jgi:hypothetical protein